MKKLLLLAIVLAFGSTAFAQNHIKANEKADKANMMPFTDTTTPFHGKTTVTCPNGIEINQDSIEVTHINRIQSDPNNQITIYTPIDSTSFIPAQPDTTWFTRVEVMQLFEMDVVSLDLDSLSIYQFQADLNFKTVGSEDDFDIKLYTGTTGQSADQTSRVYPATPAIHTETIVPSFFWMPSSDRPDFDYAGLNSNNVEFDDPPNLINDANFFANNSVFLSFVTNDPAKDDSVFHVTGTDGTGDAAAELYFGQENLSNNTVVYRNAIHDFDSTSETDADLYVIPYFAVFKCETITNREAAIGYDGLKMHAIYPNPVDDQLNVSFELEDASQNASVAVFDNTGRMVFSTELGNHLPDMQYDYSFDVSHLAAGSYSLRMMTDVGSMGMRVIKK